MKQQRQNRSTRAGQADAAVATTFGLLLRLAKWWLCVALGLAGSSPALDVRLPWLCMTALLAAAAAAIGVGLGVVSVISGWNDMSGLVGSRLYGLTGQRHEVDPPVNNYDHPASVRRVRVCRVYRQRDESAMAFCGVAKSATVVCLSVDTNDPWGGLLHLTGPSVLRFAK